MSSREKVYEYMNKCGVLYLATINNNKPKLRPLGFRMMVDGQIYFLTGTFKQVYNQMIRNNNIEFLGHNGSEFIRYYGKVIFDEDEDKSLLKKAFEKICYRFINDFIYNFFKWYIWLLFRTYLYLSLDIYNRISQKC